MGLVSAFRLLRQDGSGQRMKLTCGNSLEDIMTQKRIAFVALFTFGAMLLATSLPAHAADVSAVQVSEKAEVIPTYLTGDPELNPMFYFGRTSQGAQAPVY